LRRILQISVIVVLTILFLWLFLRSSNLSDVWRIVESTSMAWLALGLFVNWFALVFRTIRWRTILPADEPPAFYPTFFANTCGYMLSTVLPIRAGDVARPALLARRTNVRFSAALGTVLTERVLDLYSLLLLYVYFAFAHWRDYSGSTSFFIIRSGAVGAAVVLVALTIFIFGLYFFRGGIRKAHAFVGRILPERFRASWMHFFDSFADSLDITERPAALVKVLLCTAGVWFCLTAQFWLVTIAMHRRLPFDASFFVTGITTLGLAIPTPGGVGGFHKACQLVLTNFYAYDIDSSVAVAIVFHLVGTLPVLITGLVLFVREGLSWRELKSAGNEEG
jgi:glycosyltransferase 2 family protein